MSARAMRTEKLEFRVTPATKHTLQAAASVRHRSLTDFVLEGALAKADEVLADRRMFILTPNQWKEFEAALDAPVQPRQRLQRLLTEPGFFDPPAEH